MRRFTDNYLELVYRKPGDWYIQPINNSWYARPNIHSRGLQYPIRDTDSYRRLEMITILLRLGAI